MGPRPDLDNVILEQTGRPEELGVPAPPTLGNESAGTELDTEVKKAEEGDATKFSAESADLEDSSGERSKVDKLQIYFPENAGWAPLSAFSPTMIVITVFMFAALATHQVTWTTAKRNQMLGNTNMLEFVVSGAFAGMNRGVSYGSMTWFAVHILLNNQNLKISYGMCVFCVLTPVVESAVMKTVIFGIVAWLIATLVTLCKAETVSTARRIFILKMYGIMVVILFPTYVVILFMKTVLERIGDNPMVSAAAFPLLSWVCVVSLQSVLLLVWNHEEDKPEVKPPGLGIFFAVEMARYCAEFFNYCGIMLLVNKYRGTDKLVTAAIQFLVLRALLTMPNRLGIWDFVLHKLFHRFGFDGKMNANRDLIGRAAHGAAWQGLFVLLGWGVLALVTSLDENHYDTGSKEPMLWISGVALWMLSMSVELLAAFAVKLQRKNLQPELTLARAFKGLSKPGNQSSFTSSATNGALVFRHLPDGEIATPCGMAKHALGAAGAAWMCLGVSMWATSKQLMESEAM